MPGHENLEPAQPPAAAAAAATTRSNVGRFAGAPEAAPPLAAAAAGGPGVPPMPSADEDPAGEPAPVDPVTGVSRMQALWVHAGGRGAGPGDWNRARHRSAEYAAPHVVTRRGTPVLLHAAFSRAPTHGMDRGLRRARDRWGTLAWSPT
ncbi:unnamed protein product [Lampetra fluviatilis]